MRKSNYLMSKVTGLLLTLFTAISMISCEDILGEWDNPAQRIVNTIVENTGATASEVSALVEAAMSDAAIQQALATGESIKVNVAGGTSTSASNQTITIPMTTPSGNKKVEIEINFTDVITASEDNPLEFKAATGAGNASAEESDNELTISMPTATGLVISIELPNTTVTLTTNGTSTVYKSVISKTAKQTLIIKNGVTVEEIRVDGGTVRVEEGGTVNTYVYPAGRFDEYFGDAIVYAWDQGVTPAYAWVEEDNAEKYELCTDEAGQMPYFAHSLKITPGTAEYAKVAFWNETYSNDDGALISHFPLEKFIITDGAKALVEWHTIAKELIGEGTSEIRLKGDADWHDEENDRYNLAVGFECPERIYNLSFTPPLNTWDELPEGATTYSVLNNLPANLEKCIFHYDRVEFGKHTGDLVPAGIIPTNPSKALNCTFNSKEIFMFMPTDQETLDFTFDNCTFGEDCRIIIEPVEGGPAQYTGLTFNLMFTDCGNLEEIKSLLDLHAIRDFENDSNNHVKIIINIGGTSYRVNSDGDDLVSAEA